MSGNFNIKSEAFENNGVIPQKHGCPEHISPHLTISNIPSGTQSLIFLIEDPDAQKVVGKTYMHFIGQLPKDIKEIPENELDKFVKVALKNDSGHKKYFGPCPPKGEHRYHFTLIALDKPIDIENFDSNYFRDTCNKSSKFYQEWNGNFSGFAQITGRYNAHN